MATIDLSAPTPAPEGTLEGLPRRLALTLPELQLLAAKAGGAPLPFELAETGGQNENALENRLGQSRPSTEDAAYLNALETLHAPEESLTKRGLLDGDTADTGVVGALGLLATPSAAVDIDLNIGGIRAKAWHRQRGSAVAALATSDGVVFELAWFESSHWASELGRVPVLPEEKSLNTSRGGSAVGESVDLPYELLDAGAEAIRSGRNDLLDTIVANHSGASRDAQGKPLGDTEVSSLISSLVGETRGRLRALVADVEAGVGAVGVVGVVSWVLLADGWRSLRPHQEGGVSRVEVRRANATELAADLGPVLAEVSA